MLLDVPVVLGTRHAVGTRESFHIARVELAQFREGNGLRSATLVAAEKVKEEPTTVVDRKGATTIKALSLNLMSHSGTNPAYDRTLLPFRL